MKPSSKNGSTPTDVNPPIDVSSIHATVDQARREINHGNVSLVACWSILLASSAVLLVGLGYIFGGYRVPWWVYIAALLLAGILFGLGWLWRRVDDHDAALRIDETFDLADGVSTARAFEEAHRAGGFYVLQKRWAESALKKVRIPALRPQLPGKLMVATVVLGLLAILLGFRPPSPAVIEAEEQARATLALGEAINQGIQEEVEDQIDAAGELEKPLLKPEGLREMAKRLGISEDRADLMRQYAAMEQELAQQSQGLQQKQAEQLLNDAAARLADAASTQSLAEALKQKRYKDAARPQSQT